MKLALLIYSYFPYGGQQRDFYRIAQECIRRGHEVIIYTLKWQGAALANASIRFVPVTSYSRTRLYQKYSDWVKLELEKNPCDAVLGFSKMPGLDIYFAADSCFAEKAEKQRAWYYRFTPRYRHFMNFEKIVFNSASKTRVLILSPLQQRSYERYYPGSSSRFTLMPPGIDRDRMIVDDAAQARLETRKEFEISESELLIAQIGSGFRIKGVDRSLKAIASLPSELRSRVKYLLIGQDSAARFKRLARQLGIENLLLVSTGRDDIARIMQGADLLLHPAYSESAGYVLLEATIAGLPVLTSASCGYAFRIEAARSGIVCQEPFQQEELNSRLLEMLSSEKRQEWSANGREYGLRDELYALPQAAGNFIEQVVNDKRAGQHAVS